MAQNIESKKYSGTRNDNSGANKLTKALFIIYLILLFWILLFKFGVRFSYMEERIVNLVPFKSLIEGGKIDKAEIILNVMIFIPLGIYAGILFRSWIFSKKLFLFFLISLLFEALQVIFKIGAFDATDIVNNTLGGVIGLILFKLFEKLFNNRFKAQRFVNIIATLGTLLMIALLILLKLNMLPVRYQ